MLRVPALGGVAGLRSTPGRTGVLSGSAGGSIRPVSIGAWRDKIGRPDGGGVSRRP